MTNTCALIIEYILQSQSFIQTQIGSRGNLLMVAQIATLHQFSLVVSQSTTYTL